NEPQSLNFGYTVFGQLVTGQAIYNDIQNAPTTSQNGLNIINNKITIDSASIVTDTQDAVLQISEPSTFTGNATITVTASATGDGSVARSFNVSAAPPVASNSQPLVLQPVANLSTAKGTAAIFTLSTTALFGVSLNQSIFSVTGASGFT